MALLQEVDYGTPARVAETLVNLEIDGKPVTVPAGTSVMHAAVVAWVTCAVLSAPSRADAHGPPCRVP